MCSAVHAAVLFFKCLLPVLLCDLVTELLCVLWHALLCVLLCALLLSTHMHAVLCCCCRLELVSIKCQLLVLGTHGSDSGLRSPIAATRLVIRSIECVA